LPARQGLCVHAWRLCFRAHVPHGLYITQAFCCWAAPLAIAGMGRPGVRARALWHAAGPRLSSGAGTTPRLAPAVRPPGRPPPPHAHAGCPQQSNQHCSHCFVVWPCGMLKSVYCIPTTGVSSLCCGVFHSTCVRPPAAGTHGMHARPAGRQRAGPGTLSRGAPGSHPRLPPLCCCRCCCLGGATTCGACAPLSPPRCVPLGARHPQTPAGVWGGAAPSPGFSSAPLQPPWLLLCRVLPHHMYVSLTVLPVWTPSSVPPPRCAASGARVGWPVAPRLLEEPPAHPPPSRRGPIRACVCAVMCAWWLLVLACRALVHAGSQPPAPPWPPCVPHSSAGIVLFTAPSCLALGSCRKAAWLVCAVGRGFVYVGGTGLAFVQPPQGACWFGLGVLMSSC
jgi:hypothetical protein